jgi:cell division protease FtsH
MQKNNEQGNNSNKGGDQEKNPRNNNRKILTNLITIIILIGALVGFFMYADSQTSSMTPEKNYTDLITAARAGRVAEIELSEDKTKLTAKLYKNPENKDRNPNNLETQTFPTVGNEGNKSVYELLQNDLQGSNQKLGAGQGEIVWRERKPGPFSFLFNPGTLQAVILLVGTLIIGLFLLRRLGEMNNRSISFGNSRSKTYDENSTDKIKFSDVAGNEEAKQELTEVVDFLKRPEEYAKMGAKIPRGVLLVGGPGTGKTLMAKAVAGEAQVPFMYVSGSEFVEMFVGVGASRVRDLFRQAKKKAPCVIFIDEIDAVGRQRGAGLGGGNDEREQTLNQILVEMDGFDPADYIIVVGATNRPDVLDPALLRPGRFDRQVTVTLPDRKEREAILNLHAKNKKFASNVDLGIIAKRTPGFSGADLQNVLNEAAILAVRAKSNVITDEHAREAIEKVMLGPSLKSKVITDTQKALTAYHEAGHALVQTVIPEANKVQKITIIPRGRAAGYTFNAEKENDAITKKRSEFLAEICALFGGYVAEETIFGEVSTGASNDLQRATEMARDMVTKYGMSNLGPISFDHGKGMSFLGRDMMEKQNYSEESAKIIDRETKEILNACYKRTQDIITKYVSDLHNLARTLIDKEVIEYEEFNALIAHLLPKS